MAQYDLYQLESGELVVDLQTDLLGLDASRIVAPLRDTKSFVALPGLTPEVAFEGRKWIVRVHELCAVPKGALTGPVGSLRAHKGDLKQAVKALIDGF